MVKEPPLEPGKVRITTHPGEMLREEFLKLIGLSMNRLALDLHVPASRIDDLVHEQRGITAV